MNPEAHTQVDNNVIKIALLENNQVIFERIDKAVENNGAKITKAVNDKTDGYIGQITALASCQGEHTIRIGVLEARLTNIWAKISAAIIVTNIIVGAIVYLVVAGHVGGK